MNQVVSNYSRSRHILAMLLIFVILAGVIFFIIWARISKIDISTHAPGVVVPSSRIQSIQSLDGGVLDKIHVKEGDVVEKGQLLFSLDKVKAQSLYRETQAKTLSLRAAITRLRSEVFGRPLVFDSELNLTHDIVASQRVLFQKRKFALEEEVAALERSLELAKKELKLNEPMLASGEVSEVDVIRLRRQVNEILGMITQRKNKFLSDAQSELVKAEEELAVQNEILVARRAQYENAEIFAPLKGVVKNVRITTQGGVVRPAEEVMQIVPLEEELLIDVKINPVDVAFLKPGLKATVMIDAYDYTIYGMLDGELTYLSPDTLREETSREDIKYYRGTIRTYGSKLNNPNNEKIQIIPGMTALVNIKTGERTIMKYLLQPIVRGLEESMHER